MLYPLIQTGQALQGLQLVRAAWRAGVSEAGRTGGQCRAEGLCQEGAGALLEGQGPEVWAPLRTLSAARRKFPAPRSNDRERRPGWEEAPGGCGLQGAWGSVGEEVVSPNSLRFCGSETELPAGSGPSAWCRCTGSGQPGQGQFRAAALLGGNSGPCLQVPEAGSACTACVFAVSLLKCSLRSLGVQPN
uniref:Uncharacterized protein n=1 Tax=Pipistrellus kuhlii TaxID=59472 RepID=A0A7J7YMS4_PIPKU|nr:hypothetical protein mPipKuh1_010162 [Pipistrellus kuhlii]